MEIKTIAVINLPNGITLLRILCSLTLLFCMPLSLPFYVLYTAAGLSDILDGFIARKTNTATQFGAKLDTFADIVFTAVALIKILPILKLPVWVIAWVGVIALIKLVNLVIGFVRLSIRSRERCCLYSPLRFQSSTYDTRLRLSALSR